MSNSYLYIFLLASILGIAACAPTRHVPEGDYLYTGASVKVRGKEVKGDEQRLLSEELENIMRPRPNRRFLGIPFGLVIYSTFGTPGKEKGLGNWISRKLGEEPVLYSDVRTGFQRNLIRNRLENRGYFHVSLEADSTITKKRVSYRYDVDPGRQYLIDTILFPSDSSVLATAIRSTTKKSFLKIDHAFDLDVIKAERERIDARLKEDGFYYFSPDYLLILADTTGGSFSVTMKVIVKPETPRRAQERFTIRNLYIYPRHSLKDTVQSGDSVRHNEFVIIDREDTFNPALFEQVLAFREGHIYNRTNHNRSLSKLIDLGVFKYVENKFIDVGNSQLDAYYYMTPQKKKSLRLSTSGRSTSTSFVGAEANLSWQNRNAFGGAENVRFSIYGGTDLQISGINTSNNLYRVGAELNVSIPRFIAPFKVITPIAFVPRTRFGIGYDRLNRVGSYVLNSFRASVGYQWKENTRTEHQLTLYGVNYIQPSNISAEYQMQLDEDPTLANAIQKQFILGPSYQYESTNTAENRKHTYYYNGNIDLSGNVPGLISGADFKKGDTKEIFNAEFAQYLKTDHDIRYYNNLGRGSSFAARFFGGFGFAYGNSKAIPFVKQYFGGGSSGLRAFRARSLGPGTFRADNIGIDAIAADQTGDIRLEMNLEYRPKISGILKGALFIDAGNIWLLRPDDERPGAAISGDFLNELAVDFGVGLRFDFSFFVLRGDVAIPLRKPWLPDSDRWVINAFAFGDPDWRKENLVFNLAIGYPF